MIPIHLDKPTAAAMSEKLKVFAQPQRLMILSFLLSGEFTVGEIDDATGIGQPALSQQLAELRRADLVNTRREAKQIYYRLANDQVKECIKTIEAMFSLGEIQKRVPQARLQKYSSPRLAVALGAAGFAKVIRPGE